MKPKKSLVPLAKETSIIRHATFIMIIGKKGNEMK
jgi:hypothetical protein